MKIITTNALYDYSILKSDTQRLLSEYPFIKMLNIGSSVLSKDIFCLRWGEGAKKVFINAAHHGNEWITSMLVMRMLEEISYLYANNMSVGDCALEELYKSTSLYVCPMVNPDGVGLSINGLTDDIPKITRTRLISYNSDSNDFIGKWQANLHGVDLNHNYNASFEKGKFYESRLGIFGPCSSRFSGPAPESEPESRAMVEFTNMLFPDIVIAYHSQGEVIYYDYEGRAGTQTKTLARQIAEISGYSLDQTEGMASYSGYKDWVIYKYGIPAYTIEIGLGENPLPLSQFESIFDKNLPVLLHILR